MSSVSGAAQRRRRASPIAVGSKGGDQVPSSSSITGNLHAHNLGHGACRVPQRYQPLVFDELSEEEEHWFAAGGLRRGAWLDGVGQVMYRRGAGPVADPFQE